MLIAKLFALYAYTKIVGDWFHKYIAKRMLLLRLILLVLGFLDCFNDFILRNIF